MATKTTSPKNNKPYKNDFSAGGLVWDKKEKKVLVIYVKNLTNEKVWTFPKGHPENKESDEQAALREVREETGWDANILKSLKKVEYFYTHKKIRFKKVVRWFLMEPIKKVGDFDPKEILECQWCDLKKAKALISYESDKILLKQLSNEVQGSL